MSNIELSTNQRTVLELAVATEGRIERYPAGLLGGARTSVVRGLLRNGFVEQHDAGYRLTADGYAAAGAEAPAGDDPDSAGGSDSEAPNESASDTDTGLTDGAATAPADSAATAATPPVKPKRAARGDTKIAKVVDLLVRPQGATIAQIMAETEWQQHSVRGFLAGTVKKKGYTVTSSKEGDGDRVYRIATEKAKVRSGAAAAHGDEEE
ncbi:hypothetical protein GLE_5517 [Lysobacter enzymogenes]|uniref:Uncharacterized protein n=1 Tax=Lysobacter enzymogenes TaxID=69 RepID=A0A0S2DQS5_LYSEN|nr:DUF3489 domain-containing protein [Lysobacter enzymogenes]ALN60858.1 hypothetical protein GLE_5517 [Lysobacter enzymogenes]QCW24418.1 DUF3489 domain-containing protein [Lysobacter enzymogenes]